MILSFSFPSCKVRGIPLLELLGSAGSSGAFDKCSLVPGTEMLADQWYKHKQISKNEHLYTTAFLLGSAQGAQDPDTIRELFGSVITVCFCSFLGLHSPAQC